MRILAGGTVWLRRIVDIALIALIVTVLAGVALGKLVPLTGRQTIVIGGGSMSPTLPLGSAVVIAPVAPADLSVGDVVTLRISSQNAIFTHRIVTVVDRDDGIWLRTKGDANATPDPSLVPASAVLGRVELGIPAIGYLIAVLSEPIGVLFVIGFGATLLAIAWLLESLEPPRTVARRTATAAAREAPSEPTTSSAVPAWFVTGEPMSLRSRTLVASGPSLSLAGVGGAGLLLPVVGPMSLRLVASRSRTSLRPDPAARPRPTAREQLARSRENRGRQEQFRTRDGRRAAS